MDNTASNPEPHPVSNDGQAIINVIRKARSLYPADVAQILMALSCQLAKDPNAHIHEDTIKELDLMALYLEESIET